MPNTATAPAFGIDADYLRRVGCLPEKMAAETAVPKISATSILPCVPKSLDIDGMPFAL